MHTAFLVPGHGSCACIFYFFTFYFF